MLGALRKEKIKSILFNDKVVSVSALAERFQVSEETIRRDLTALEEEGVLGGAILANKVLGDPATHVLQNVFVENKEKIAAVCKPFIQPRDYLFFDSSTTAYYVCKEMPDVELTVLTNSLSILNLLAPREKINLIAFLLFPVACILLCIMVARVRAWSMLCVLVSLICMLLLYVFGSYQTTVAGVSLCILVAGIILCPFLPEKSR